VLRAYLESGEKACDSLSKLGDDVAKQWVWALSTAVSPDLLSLSVHSCPPTLPAIEMYLTTRPCFDSWSESESQSVIKALYNFGIPHTANGDRDCAEFHSLTFVTAKSTAMISVFSLYRLESVREAMPDDQLGLLPVGDQIPKPAETPILIHASAAANLRARCELLDYLRQLTRKSLILARLSHEVPADWTAQHDIALVRGICQFGFSRIAHLSGLYMSLLRCTQVSRGIA
jgi:hypothetical protein